LVFRYLLSHPSDALLNFGIEPTYPLQEPCMRNAYRPQNFLVRRLFMQRLLETLRWAPGVQKQSMQAGALIHKTNRLSIIITVALVFGFIASSTLVLAASNMPDNAPAASVNPFVGTGRGPGPDINSSNENLFPGATMPFGMVQLSPDTESHGYGYHYFQGTIQGFSMTHMSGVGCPNEGDVFFTATSGRVLTQVQNFQSPYSHTQEAASPGYYQVDLSRFGINAELTAATRAGLVKFSFPAGKAANILVPISHTLNRTVAGSVHVSGDREIDGYVTNEAFCGSHQTYRVYFAMIFSRPFSSFGTWNGHQSDNSEEPDSGNRAANQDQPTQWIGAYATWPAAVHSQAITARIGVSYVDLAGARNNLKTEVADKDFSAVRQEATAAWNRALSVIDVSGSTVRDRKVFYTALYHSLIMPSILSDADGRYLGFDNQIHHVATGHAIYGNFSGWDIYRSEMPLLALIEPQRMEDMAQSIVLMYQQGGWIGRWPQINRYTNVMAGSPLTTVLSTAWLDGLHNFNIQAAWKGMLLDSTETPPTDKPYTGQAGIQWINRVHYVPNDKVDYGSVSQIQEDGIAYASLYRLAKVLGKSYDARTLYQRALYERNVFDNKDRFFRPRNADGQWIEPFDPSQGDHGFIEGSGWDYQWMAPWDMAWLIRAVEPDHFNQRLNEFFNYKEPGWNGQYYNPYNEADLEAPFEFNFSGQPWESQRTVRRILAENYFDAPGGIPGNDDCGEMSSWAVLSMMGIYTVDPSSLAYELVSPVFPQIVVHLHTPYRGRTFTIETSENPETTPYIQSVKLNGHIHPRNWISFREISDGGVLRVSLGADPNRSWGSGAKDIPPSLSDAQP
jgi:predicted alpha-1,2-mannosidase